MKLFVLLTYNKSYNKILLCMLALINSEKAETVEKIFIFLKINFQLNLELITVDFGKAGLKAISKTFPNARIFPCHYVYILKI